MDGGAGRMAAPGAAARRFAAARSRDPTALPRPAPVAGRARGSPPVGSHGAKRWRPSLVLSGGAHARGCNSDGGLRRARPGERDVRLPAGTLGGAQGLHFACPSARGDACRHVPAGRLRRGRPRRRWPAGRVRGHRDGGGHDLFSGRNSHVVGRCARPGHDDHGLSYPRAGRPSPQ